ncbi:MAG: AIR carboxylase family protein, partial [Crenarchaeota archaeon]|nr:AIR carboxylase family protein [Thermoproteota archaeon]
MSRKNGLIVFMGSKSDLPFAERIGEFLVQEGFSLRCEYNVASAHKTPDVLIRKLEAYERTG